MNASKLFRWASVLLLTLSCALYAQDLSEDNGVANPEATTDSSNSSNSTTTDSGNSEMSDETSQMDPSKADIYVNSKTSFAIEAEDDSSAVDYIEYKVNEGEYVKYTAPITLLKEGISKITYRAVDKAGNKEPAKALVVVVDNTAPAVELIPSETLFTNEGYNYASKNVTYSIKAEDVLSGVNAIKYSVNGSDIMEYQEQPLKLEKSGVNLLKFFAEDNSGNVSPESVMVITVDDVQPEVEIQETTPLVRLGGKTYSKKGNSFTIKANDAQSGVRRVLVRVDGKADFVPYAEPITIDAQGEHTIEAKAIDNVGNESQVKKVTFMVDINPPKTQIRKIQNSGQSASAEPAPAPAESTQPDQTLEPVNQQ